MSGSPDRLKIVQAKADKLRKQAVVSSMETTPEPVVEVPWDYDGRPELEDDMLALSYAVHGPIAQSLYSMMDMAEMS